MADTIVKAADSTIFNSRGLWGPYWMSPLIGAKVYVDSGLDIAAIKTTDGGATWSTPVLLAMNCDQLAAFPDIQVVGDTGDKIHIAALDGAADLLYYNNFDISANAWATSVTAAHVGASTTDNANKVFITKTRSGNIVMGAVTSGVINVVRKLASPWSSMTTIASPFETNANDAVLGVYCNTGDDNDAAILFWDASSSEISIKVYDDSLDTWANETLIAGSNILNTTQHAWGATTRLSDGHVLLAAHPNHSASAAIATYDLNLNSVASPTVTAKTSTVTVAGAEPRIFVDQSNDDVYVFWLSGTVFASLQHVNYRKSTDDMTSWGSTIQVDEDAEDDHRLIGPTAMGPASQGGRFQPAWFNDDLNNIYNNLNTDIEIAAVGGGDSVTPTETLSPRIDETIAVQEILALTDSLTPRIDETIAKSGTGEDPKFDAASQGYITDSNTLTFSHTVGALSDRLLIVDVGTRGGQTVTGITFNGDALTKRLHIQPGGDVRTERWYLIAPDVGTHDVVLTMGSVQSFGAGSHSWYDVDQTTPLGTDISGSASAATDGSLIVETLGADDIAVVVVGDQSGGNDATADGGNTHVVNMDGTHSDLDVFSKPRTGDATQVDWTYDNPEIFAFIGNAIRGTFVEGPSGETLTPTDTISPRIDETLAILEPEVTVESFPVLLTEVLAVLEPAATTETLSPRLDETATVLEIIALADSVTVNGVDSAAVVEGQSLDITETLSPRLDDAILDIQEFQSATPTETLTPRLDDAIAAIVDVQINFETTETIAPNIIEGKYGPQAHTNPNVNTNITGWGPRASAVVTHETANPIEGAGSVKVATSGVAQSGVNGVLTAAGTAAIGQTWIVQAKVRAPVGKTFRLHVTERNAAGSATTEYVTPALVGTGNTQVATAIGTFVGALTSRMSGAVVDLSSTVYDFYVDDMEYYQLLPTEVYDDAAIAETLSPRLDDALLGSDTLPSIDTLSPRLDDTLAILEPAVTTENFPILVTEAITAVGDVAAVSESFPVLITDSIVAFDTAAVSDSLLPLLVDASTMLELMALVDSLTPKLTEDPLTKVDVTGEVDVPGQRIWAIAYNSSGVGIAILPRIFAAWTEEAVNEVGRFEAIISGTDPALPLLVEGGELGIWSEPEGEVFRGRMEQFALVNTDDEPRIAIRGMSVAVELLWEWLYHGKILNNVSVSTALTALLRAGWTNVVTGTGFQTVTNRYHTMNAWRAANLIADSQSGYIRETSTPRQLEIKRGTTQSGIVLTNQEQYNPYRLAASTRFGVVGGIPLYQRDGSQIINQLSVVTTREKEADVTLQESTRVSPYTIQSRFVNSPSVVAVFGSPGVGDTDNVHVKVAGVNRYVLAFVAMVDGAGIDEPENADYLLGGHIMSKIAGGFLSGPGQQYHAYGLVNPPVGDLALTVRVPNWNPTGSEPGDPINYAGVILISLQDVDQINPVRSSGSSTGTTGTITRNVTSVANDLVIDGVLMTPDRTPTPGAGQTLLLDRNVNPVLNRAEFASSEIATGVSTTMSWSLSGASTAWRQIGIALRPALTYYIEDAASQTAYGGVRATGISLSNLSSVVPRNFVANMLYDHGVDYLGKFKDPLETLELSVNSLPLPTTWLVGDSMHFVYRGRARGDAVWLEKDEHYPVLKRRRQWDDAGVLSWDLTLGNVYRNPTDLTTYVETSKSRLDDIRA